MPNFLVTVQYSMYDPERKDTAYVVENVPDKWAARKHVKENILGYEPGAPMLTIELPLRETPASTKKEKKS